jgi:hypothetical protein
MDNREILLTGEATNEALRPRSTATLVWFGLVGFSFDASLGPNEGPERGAALRKPLLLINNAVPQFHDMFHDMFVMFHDMFHDMFVH